MPVETAVENPRVIALFDVDGTLTQPRGEITKDMMAFLKELSKKVVVGIVGGSDLPKQEEQLGKGIVDVFPYNFSLQFSKVTCPLPNRDADSALSVR